MNTVWHWDGFYEFILLWMLAAFAGIVLGFLLGRGYR